MGDGIRTSETQAAEVASNAITNVGLDKIAANNDWQLPNLEITDTPPKFDTMPYIPGRDNDKIEYMPYIQTGKS